MNALSRKSQPATVFLSYSSEDKSSAEKIRSLLRTAGLEVWDSAEQVKAGENLGEAVGKALETSDAMVALISPALARSPWVTREIEFALTQSRYRGRLVPVLVRPTRKYPWILESLGLIDATEDLPQAAKRAVAALKAPNQTASLAN